MIEQQPISYLDKIEKLSLPEQLQLSKLYIRDLKDLIYIKDKEFTKACIQLDKLTKQVREYSNMSKLERKDFKREMYIESLLFKIKDLESSVNRLRNDYNTLLTKTLVK